MVVEIAYHLMGRNGKVQVTVRMTYPLVVALAARVRWPLALSDDIAYGHSHEWRRSVARGISPFVRTRPLALTERH